MRNLARGRLVLGIIILAFGVLALLHGLKITDISLGKLIADYWPLLLIAWGAGFLCERTGTGGKVVGSLVFLLGIGFLGNNLGWFTFNVWQVFWPVLLILLGISFLFGFRNGGSRSNLAIMSGVERKNIWDLESGSYLAFMGGIDLDLRRANIPEETIHLNLNAFMGGINIVVPPDLAVACEGTAMLGGVEFFHKNSGGIISNLHEQQGDVKGKQVVRISGFAMMGGITVMTATAGEKVD